MRAGNLRHRIDIQRRTETKSQTGSPTETWADIHQNVPAFIEPIPGSERYDEQQRQTAANFSVHMRYRDGITAKDRVIDLGNGLTYVIIAPPIDVDGRNRELQLNCQLIN